MTREGDRGEFFVAYLAMPPGLRRWLVGAVVIVGIVAAAVAAGVAARQRDPGGAVWDLEARMLAGTLTLRPYPLLWLDDGDPSPVLLVGVGKRRLADGEHADHQRVRVTGTSLSRGEIRMLEVYRLDVLGPADAPTPGPSSPDAVELVGELIDSKCFLGAMKPGEGNAHKGCAVLCLRGGVPPAILIRDGNGEQMHLLVMPEGEALDRAAIELIVPYVGERVRLAGQRHTRGTLSIISIDPSTLQPAGR